MEKSYSSRTISGKIYHRYSFSSEEDNNNNNHDDDEKHEEENQLVPVNQNQALVPMYQKHIPPPGTYVVQIPKDQIYRIPPPENARRFENYTRRKNRPNRCCNCLLWISIFLTTLAFLIAITAGVLYFVFRPKSLKFTVDKVSIQGFNNLSSSVIMPDFDITIGIQNPNKKLGFYYNEGSSVIVSLSTVKLATGTFPVFFQPSNNLTVFQTALTNKGLQLSNETKKTLTEDQKKREIPLGFYFEVPVKVKVSSVKSWTITVKINCNVNVDKLTVNSTILSNRCDSKVKIF